MQPVAWFHASDVPGREFRVEDVVEHPERLQTADIRAVREYYERRARAKYLAALTGELSFVVRNIFIALSREERFVFIREVEHSDMSMPIRGEMPILEMRPYLTDGRNLRGYDGVLFRELERYGRPFLVLQAPRVFMWLEIS